MFTAYPIVRVVNPNHGVYDGTSGVISVSVDKGAPCFASVVAEEVREARFKSMYLGGVLAFAGCIAAIISILYGLSPQMTVLYSCALGMLCVLFVQRRSAYDRAVELRGRSTNLSVLVRWYGKNLDTVLAGMAQSDLAPGVYPQFQGWSAEKYQAEIRAYLPEADKWVSNNSAMITAAYKYGQTAGA